LAIHLNGNKNDKFCFVKNNYNFKHLLLGKTKMVKCQKKDVRLRSN
jgi:hypothetical protein